MYEDILLPVDGSADSAEALHHAGELAHWADATVQVLYVADTARDSVTVVDGETVDALVQKGEDVVEEATETLETLGVACDGDVVQGNPAPTVVEYAQRYDQDLVVMQTRGHEGVMRYLTGSVSEKVVRLSSLPVLTVRTRPDETLEFPYEDILVPTDGSDAATQAAEHAVELAASLDATVHALSVVDDTALGVSVRSTATGAKSERAAADAVEAVVSAASNHKVSETVSHVEHGTPIEEITDCIESNELHAVVMGTTGRRGTERILLGSVAEKTVRSAPVPVMTVARAD